MSNSTQIEQFEDAMLTTAATPENVAAGLEASGCALGLMAYLWGYPLVRMERVARQYTMVEDPKPPTSYRAPLNQIGWAQSLATPVALDMPTGNNDTFYMSSIVQLDEPFVLSVPDTNDRYYVVDVFNMWQELEHYIGRRTTGTKAGTYALVPPKWKGELPSGVDRLDNSTSKIWLWGRLRLSQGEDAAAVLALQEQFKLVPLSLYGKADAVPHEVTLEPLPSIAGKEFGFFEHLAFALKSNDIKEVDKALFGQFAAIGLTKEGFKADSLSEAVKVGLRRALADAPKAASAAFALTATKRNGWDWVTGLDNFGYNYTLRAVVAGPYLGGQGEQEAMYPIRYTDREGQPLNGKNNYVLKFNGEPPVDAFWSLTVYDAETKMLIVNPDKRYKVGSDTPGLLRNPDGSFELYLQHQKPKGSRAANWAPTPEGNFYTILRLYQPRPEVLDGSYLLPTVMKA